jgi:hypothetical protein
MTRSRFLPILSESEPKRGDRRVDARFMSRYIPMAAERVYPRFMLRMRRNWLEELPRVKTNWARKKTRSPGWYCPSLRFGFGRSFFPGPPFVSRRNSRITAPIAAGTRDMRKKV